MKPASPATERTHATERCYTIAAWQEHFERHAPFSDSDRWVEVLEQGLMALNCVVNAADLLHLFGEYALNMLTFHELDDLPADVRARMDRVLTILYSDRISAEVDAIKARYRPPSAATPLTADAKHAP